MSRKVVSLSLPEPLFNYLNSRIDMGGYSSASEYIRELIRNDIRRNADEPDLYCELPERLRVGPTIRTVDLTKVFD